MSRKITRKEALELSQKTLEDAERARIETVEREAKAAACPDCEDLRRELAETKRLCVWCEQFDMFIEPDGNVKICCESGRCGYLLPSVGSKTFRYIILRARKCPAFVMIGGEE